MELKIVAIILTVAGSLLLSASLLPAREIARSVHRENKAAWLFLSGLVFFFTIGYVFFFSYLVKHSMSTMDLVAAVIMFGGGVFVFGVVKATRRSVIHVKKLAEKDRFRALHDELTLLPNRSLLQDRLDYGILMAKRMQEPLAVLFLDLDRFKEINDTLGHHYGDFLLQEVAERFKSVVRASDTLARLGGDEFAMVLPGAGVCEAVKVAEKVAASLEEPFRIEGNNLTVGVSVGITVYPDHGDDSEILMQRADVAMYVAKRNEVIHAVYHPDEDKSSMDRLILIGELRDAFSKQQLILHYQPKICMHDGSLAGVEALIRWQHPEKGLIPPNTFIPLAEQAGLMNVLTNWVLDKAMEQNALWRKSGYFLPVAVNLSVKNLQDMDFPDRVLGLMEKWQTPVRQLVLEITESSMMTDPVRVQAVVEKLTAAGLKMSIDDYGTGYSSLAYLRRFPALEIKIDQSFIRDMLENEDNRVIVHSTIDMVHNIGRKVVAEGVEDLLTMDALEELGCDCLQGYHICKPLSVENMNKWLLDTEWPVRVEG